MREILNKFFQMYQFQKKTKKTNKFAYWHQKLWADLFNSFKPVNLPLHTLKTKTHWLLLIYESFST